MPINNIPSPEFKRICRQIRLNIIITDQTPNSDPQLIQETRRLFKIEHEKEPEAFIPSDVEKLMDDDWNITRYLMCKDGDPIETTKMLVSCSKWRKDLGFPLWKPQDFPAEFYELGICFPYELDRLGNKVIYIRCGMLDRRIPCLRETLRNYLIYRINQVDEEQNGRNWALVFDCAGSGVRNFDPRLLTYMIAEIIPRFPKGMSYVILHELPKMLSRLANATIACLHRDFKRLIRILNNSELREWMPEESLPDFMGGSCNSSYQRVPIGCRSFREMASEKGWTEKDLKILFKHYRVHLDECRDTLKMVTRSDDSNMSAGSGIIDSDNEGEEDYDNESEVKELNHMAYEQHRSRGLRTV